MAKKNEEVTRRSGWKVLLRLVLVLLLLIIALVGGMIVGYTVFGKQDMSDALQWSTWRHVFDLVFAP
ncbi:DNA-directed RNA polymerase subunit beta [Fontibacillus panacisegetis]|uniref:DNA-directed RNA polymerase subunit beta n=1 Tax=Fontibacillus panacisegetis TaxID=670482 RepID=A0A1G7PMX5_9BACL|nr:DNA-directed RNA polymerase subunit beta [Fontibacillus panacisegetis]SDF87558.1 DNA-directed RNA polymerase subunit beta [Fontibacillus panacisegetis]